MDRWLYLSGGFLFLVAGIAHIGIRFWFKSQEDGEEEEVYWEFEDQDPHYHQYTRWLHATMIGGCIGLLLLFLAIAL